MGGVISEEEFCTWQGGVNGVDKLYLCIFLACVHGTPGQGRRGRTGMDSNMAMFCFVFISLSLLCFWPHFFDVQKPVGAASSTAMERA